MNKKFHKQYAILRYGEGKTKQQIADALGMEIDKVRVLSKGLSPFYWTSKEFINLKDKGYTHQQLADYFKVRKHWINIYVQQNFESNTKRGITSEQVDELKAKGFSKTKIAKTLGCSLQNLYQRNLV